MTRKQKQKRSEALDSESSKVRIRSNFGLFWHPFGSVLLLPVICGRSGFDFTLISHTFAYIENPASISASITVGTSENDN